MLTIYAVSDSIGETANQVAMAVASQFKKDVEVKRIPYVNYCLGYASTYEHLVKYLESNGDNPNMFHTTSFVSSSEVLSMKMKQKMLRLKLT